jgi:hypothetical protein
MSLKHFPISWSLFALTPSPYHKVYNSTTFAPVLATNGTSGKIGKRRSSLEKKEVNNISTVGKLGTK